MVASCLAVLQLLKSTESLLKYVRDQYAIIVVLLDFCTCLIFVYLFGMSDAVDMVYVSGISFIS